MVKEYFSQVKSQKGMRIGIITSYPDLLHPNSGIANYAQTIIEPLVGCSDEIFVFADYPPGTPAQTASSVESEVQNITILRCWRFGALAPFMILRALLAYRLDAIHVEYDVYHFGGVIAAVLLPILLTIYKHIYDVRVTTTLHGVVPQRAITREMLQENGFVLPFSRIGKLGFRIIYRLFRWMSDGVIALESELMHVLRRDYQYALEKTFTVPHPPLIKGHSVENSPASEPNEQHRNILLFFGFASVYKGLPILFDAYDIVRCMRSDIELHVIAGRHPRLAGNSKYERFYEDIHAHGSRIGATMHEYLRDEELVPLIRNASALILPYTSMYGSSGPLNTAIAYRKPLLVSTALYFEGAHPTQVFEPTVASCAKTILRFFNEHRVELEKAAVAIASARNVAIAAEANHRVRCGLDPLVPPTRSILLPTTSTISTTAQ